MCVPRSQKPMQSWRVLPPPPAVLCADWLGLSLGPVGVGRRSPLTEPPVRGVVATCGDSGAILGAEVIGAPITGGGGVGVGAGAAGADKLGVDLDWATEGALIMARSKATKMQAQNLRIADINPLLMIMRHCTRTMDRVGTPGAATPRSIRHARGVKEAGEILVDTAPPRRRDFPRRIALERLTTRLSRPRRSPLPCYRGRMRRQACPRAAQPSPAISPAMLARARSSQRTCSGSVR